MAPTVIAQSGNGQDPLEMEPNNQDEDLPVNKIKSVNTSCFCMSINSCTCIHLNGDFNKIEIKKVLALVHNKSMCDPGPSTSNHSCVKRRKILSSESSEEKVKISESKKICKVMEVDDSDDLDSDDFSADDTNVTSERPDDGTVKDRNLNNMTANDSIYSLSTYSSSSTLSTPVTSPRREDTDNESPNPSTVQSGRVPLRSFFNLLSHLGSTEPDALRVQTGDSDESTSSSDDDDDDSWLADSLDSDVVMSDDMDKVPNPEVLNKPAPKPNWCPVMELTTRQYGGHTRYQSQCLFQQRYYGSLHAVQRFELMYKMEHHKGCVNALDFHSGGSLLASASDDKRVVIWEWTRGRALYSYKSGHSSNVFQSKWLHLAGAGYVVSSARDGMIRLADLTKVGDSTPTTLMAQHKRSAHKLSVIRDTPHVVLSVGEDGRVLNVDMRETASVNSKAILVVHKDKNTLPLYSVASNPLNSNEFMVAGEDTRVHLYDKRFIITRTSKPLKMFCPSTIRKGVHCYITCAVYNNSGTEILASYNDEKIYLFDNTAKTSIGSTVDSYLHSYEGHRNSATVKGVNFYGPKSEYILSGSDDGHIYIWDRNTEAIVNWMRGDDNGVVNCIEAHPNLPVIATSGLDDNVKIWVPSCEQPPTFKGLKKTVLLNEKKRSLIESIPTDTHLRWLWQSTFDSVLNNANDEDDATRADRDDDSDDMDDPRQCSTS